MLLLPIRHHSADRVLAMAGRLLHEIPRALIQAVSCIKCGMYFELIIVCGLQGFCCMCLHFVCAASMIAFAKDLDDRLDLVVWNEDLQPPRVPIHANAFRSCRVSCLHLQTYVSLSLSIIV